MTIPLPHTGTMPTVLTLQDMQHREHPEWFSRSELLFRRLAYDAPAQRAGHVITATRHARGQIVERLGIEPDRIEVIPHGIDHARFSPSQRRVTPSGCRRSTAQSGSCCIRRTCGRIRTTNGSSKGWRGGGREVRLVLRGRTMAGSARCSSARESRRRRLALNTSGTWPPTSSPCCTAGYGNGLPEPLRRLRDPGDRGDGVRLPRRVIRSLGTPGGRERRWTAVRPDRRRRHRRSAGTLWRPMPGAQRLVQAGTYARSRVHLAPLRGRTPGRVSASIACTRGVSP